MKILALTLEKCSECAIFVDDKIIFASSEKEIDIKDVVMDFLLYYLMY